MKKMLFIAGIATCMFACTNETKDSTTGVKPDSANNTTNNTANVPATYTSSEGDVSYRNGKVMVWRNNQWVVADNDVTLDNGIIVRRNGRLVRDNEEIEFEDGIIVDKSGRFFDKTGNAIEDGWDGIKKGAKEAKEGVKKGAKEVKEEVKDVFKDDKKNQ
jgi:hypothetical protein